MSQGGKKERLSNLGLEWNCTGNNDSVKYFI